MALHLFQASYTAESIAAQIKHPQDRIAIVISTLGSSLGIERIGGGYSLGEDTVIVLVEAKDDEAVAAFVLALGAGGALKSYKVTKLLDGAEWVSALTKAQHAASTYSPAR